MSLQQPCAVVTYKPSKRDALPLMTSHQWNCTMGAGLSGLFYSKGRKNDNNEKKRKERKKLQRFNPLDMILTSYLILELLISMSVIKTLQTGSFSLRFVFELISLCVFFLTFCTLKFLLTQTVGLATSGVWTCERVFIEPWEFSALRARPFQVHLFHLHCTCMLNVFKCVSVCTFACLSFHSMNAVLPW